MKVKSARSKPRARDVIDDFAAIGKNRFSLAEFQAAFGGSAPGTRLALSRLAKKSLVASPARSFYVILPPEYRRYGCVPARQFIPDLMQRLRRRYYVALLSAAEIYGAAHQAPQVFQVALAKNRRKLVCGAARVHFLARRRIGEVPVRSIPTPQGEMLVSTPEATALDLVGYPARAAGLDNVATVLTELAESISPKGLAAAARTAPVSWSQRLGYLLELVDAADKARPLKEYVRNAAREPTALAPSVSRADAPLAADWRLWVNLDIEADI